MKKINNQQGLTILEVIIAILIAAIVTGISVIMVIRVSQYSSSAENRGLAINNAQEAIDIIKNIRDNNYCDFFADYGSASGRNYYLYPTGDTWALRDVTTLSDKWDDIYVDEAGYDRFINDSIARNATSLARLITIQNVGSGKRITVETRWLRGRESNVFDTYILGTDVYKWKY